MNTITYTAAVILAMTVTSVYAHHPSGNMVDQETYEMIESNLEGSPHLTMDVETMGSAAGIDAESGAIEEASRALSGWQSNQVQSGEVPPIDPVTSEDTIDLLENVDSALAE